MSKRKVYDDDDGRTIADMSGISRPSVFVPRREKAPRQENREPGEQGSFLFEKNAQEPFTREERRMYVLAALRASLLIAGAFIAGLGLVILIMVLAWS